MRVIKSLLLCGVASIVVGCATRPLPEDVTRKNTFKIVQGIRCEARASVISALVRELREFPSSTQLGDDVSTGDTNIIEFVNGYDAGAYNKIIQQQSHLRIAAYRRSAVGFDFRFDIHENNDNTINANFVDDLSFGTFDLNLTAGDQRERKNVRKFRVVSSFEELLRDPSLNRDCPHPYPSNANWVYPITGTIGIDEIFNTFLHIAEFSGLDTEENKFTDIVTFQTSYYGTLDPKITITSEIADFHLNDVTGHTKADRVDIHEVTIAVAIGPSSPLPVPKQRAAVVGAQGAKAEVNSILDDEKYLGTQQRIIDRLDEIR